MDIYEIQIDMLQIDGAVYRGVFRRMWGYEDPMMRSRINGPVEVEASGQKKGQNLIRTENIFQKKIYIQILKPINPCNFQLPS